LVRGRDKLDLLMRKAADMVVHISRLRGRLLLVAWTLILFSGHVSSVPAQDWSQVYQGIVGDQLRANSWFQDAASKGLPQQVQGGLGVLYNLGLMNDLGQEGLRQQLESQEWFRGASQPGPKDVKTLFQQMQ